MATILVVDDRSLNREILRALLGYFSYRIVEARNGAEALERVRQDRPDLIITDIVMPTMDGVELVKRLRADAATTQIPVIFYTATYRLTEARQLAEGCGVVTVIAKPSRPQVILDAVAAALGGAAAPAVEPARAGLQRPPPGQAVPASAEPLDWGQRLATLIELGLDLAAERDPQRLLDLACRAAEATFDARLSAIVMLGNAGGVGGRFAVLGVPDEIRPRFRDLDLGAAFVDGRPHRFNDSAATAALLPAWHPPVSTLLLVPLQLGARRFGWLSVADNHRGAATFGEDDEQIAVTLGTQVAQAYQNLVLQSATSAYATQLEAEIVERRRAQYALRESEAHFRAVFDHAPIGMAVVSMTGQFMRVNSALCKLVGYTTEDLEKLGYPDIIDADQPTEAMAELRALANGLLPTADLELRYRRRDGGKGWMLLTASVLRDETGEPPHFIIQIKDISERKQADEELKLAASVFDNTMDGIIVTDPAAQILSVNPAFTAITGYRAEEAVGKKPSLLRSEQTSPDFYCELWKDLLREGHWEGEIWNRRKSGEAYLEWLAISMVPGADGKPARYVGVFNDITELRRKDEHIRHLAFHDPLTDLPNRTLLLDRLEHAIVTAGREQRHLGLMFIDLDHFKAVNDSLGHEVGDGLLREVARRLSQCVRQSDTVARMGGDEFVILLEHARDLADYANLASMAVAVLAQPVDIDGNTMRVGASIGIACFPDDGADVAALMQSADDAMYEAKSAGRGIYRFRTPALGAGMMQGIGLEQELRNALSRGEFELYYQPVVSLASDPPLGVEALLRWRHPVRGVLLPAEFIPLAEATGLITELGDWVLDQACRQGRAWQARGLGRIRIAVTVAAAQLQCGDLSARIASLTRQHGISPADLAIKLTEDVIMAIRDNIERICGRLHEIGVSVVVDNFGRGAASLDALCRLPIDFLNIDRAFVGKVVDDAEVAQFVRSVLDLARSHQLRVVAEGVETERQVDFLRASGCTLGQGYLFARPAPAAEVEGWLRGHHRGEWAAPSQRIH